MSSPRPFLVVLGLAYAALLLQFSRFEAPFFRPFELLIDGASTFRRVQRVEMSEHGALSFRAGVESLKLRHPVVFSTDNVGLRNPSLDRSPRVVVLGDSFVAGIGLTDEATLSARLTVLLGEPVYNFGTRGVAALPVFLADRRFVDAPPRVAIYAPSGKDLDKLALPEPMTREQWEARQAQRAAEKDSLIAGHRAVGERIDRARSELDRDNGLARAAKELVGGVRYQLFGPADAIEVDGSWALVESLTEQRLHQTMEQRRLDHVVAQVVRFSEIVAARGTRLVLAPIPESGTVYPELFPQEQQARVVQPTFLERLRAEVAARGIEVIDLEPAFQRERTPYLFLRDDTHWTPRAVEIAAGEMVPVVAPMLR